MQPQGRQLINPFPRSIFFPSPYQDTSPKPPYYAHPFPKHEPAACSLPELASSYFVGPSDAADEPSLSWSFKGKPRALWGLKLETCNTCASVAERLAFGASSCKIATPNTHQNIYMTSMSKLRCWYEIHCTFILQNIVPHLISRPIFNLSHSLAGRLPTI
jgi:hypothetical protein